MKGYEYFHKALVHTRLNDFWFLKSTFKSKFLSDESRFEVD